MLIKTTPSIPYDEAISFYDKILFNHNGPYNKLSNLLPFKSPGPDNLLPFARNSLSDIACKPLAIISQTSLDTMSLPNIWKTANVSSIFKKGEKSDTPYYHPKSLASVACKIMESIIKDVVITHLQENNLLNNCQFGFVSGRSVQLQRLSLLNHWTDILDSGNTIDVIYLGFKKAFDSVPHIRLLSKLHSHGFCDQLLGWLKSFLIDDVKWFVSMILYLCGIPQGSVLGPVLFPLYVNDLPDTVASNVYMSADETKMYRPITSHEDTTIL